MTGHGWREVIASLGHPRVRVTLLLGFSSGLPFLLTGNTLGMWMREEGIDLTSIGLLSGVGIAYSLKFLWAPLIDRMDAPFLGPLLGRRRGWIALAQIVIALGLVGIASVDVKSGLGRLAVFAVAVAFASATQDIAVDAWRIERAENADDLGLLTAAFQFGYRTSLLAADSWILFLAAKTSWVTSYVTFAVLMGIGVAATFGATEPERVKPLRGADPPPLWTPRGFFDAVVGPFIAFFREHRAKALLMLAAVALYRMPDFVMGPMIGPLYVDLGLSKETIAAVRTSIGLAATFFGVALGGLSAVRIGFERTLIIGAIVGPGSNLAFTAMAVLGPRPGVFEAAMAIDNLSTGFTGAALVAYMSSLTSRGYTATQYALLSSFYALPGKFLKTLSGAAVDLLKTSYDLMTSYALFFASTAAAGLPALILCLFLIRMRRGQPQA